jgi:PAS domain S-box-containing protein
LSSSPEDFHLQAARFRAGFDNAAVGIERIGRDGQLLRVNKALCRVLGYPLDELLTKSFRDVTYPDDLAADLATYARTARSSEPGRPSVVYVRAMGQSIIM